MVTDEEIEVECNKITKDGTLQCNITTQSLTKMNLQGINPENIQFNVKDKISIPKSTQETTESVEPQTEQKPEESATETTEKSSCGCSTSNKIEDIDSEA